MNVAVVIPWIDRGCPYRRRNLAFVQDYWATLGWTIYTSMPGEPFSRARAINQGVRNCDCSGVLHPCADVVLQCDPDSLVSPHAAREAAQRAFVAPGLVVAFERYLYLDRLSTERVIADVANIGSFIGELKAEHEGLSGVGNVVAFSRETWEQAGGYDERFGTWGADDGAFAVACELTTGRPLRRVPGDMIHLHHPRLPESEDATHPEHVRSRALMMEYEAAAARGPEAMRALIASRQ